jgi:hypothetical protein
MRVDQAEGLAAGEILREHCFEERRLPDAGLPDDVDVRESIGVLDAGGFQLCSGGGAAEEGDVVRLQRFSLTDGSLLGQAAAFSSSESLAAYRTFNQNAILVTDC